MGGALRDEEFSGHLRQLKVWRVTVGEGGGNRRSGVVYAMGGRPGSRVLDGNARAWTDGNRRLVGFRRVLVDNSGSTWG
ncbi:hypothetical protein LIER_12316 [Lithospermum erythrorhizon]|uniref:Uncharacterized protein n=1 Tax=Lithospermum erythrorhizon TaxID=34254 RepID=A0AAV3PRD9_LITER